MDELRAIQAIIEYSLQEDLSGSVDVTSESIFEDSETAEAVIRSKSEGVLSGTYLIEPIFDALGEKVKIDLLTCDGQKLIAGKEICRLSGPVKTILKAERTLLNFLQHLSGISTQAAEIARTISPARLLDTRKTTPGLRVLEKRAVVHGGGENHRFGLYDMILIKDTHIKAAGGVKNALEKAFAYKKRNDGLKIEVEVQSIKDFEQALSLAPNRIMLDNMGLDAMGTCVKMRNDAESKTELEASGNVDSTTAWQIAQTGVDFISCGAITHSAPALDIHLIIL